MPMQVCRYYKNCPSNKTITFNVNSTTWKQVAIRNSGSAKKYADLTFNADGTGSFSVVGGNVFEVVFANQVIDTAGWASLDTPYQAAVDGGVTFGNDDPPPPPPPPETRPNVAFVPADSKVRPR